MLAYHLYAAAATTSGVAAETFVKVATYDGLSMSFVLSRTAETSQVFTTGKLYRFQFSARNAIGEGEQSPPLTVALAAPATRPAAPTVTRSACTLSSLYITWAAVASADALPIDGYKLYLSEPGSGATRTVYDGSRNSERLFFNVTGLQTGAHYLFWVTSVNANGES